MARRFGHANQMRSTRTNNKKEASKMKNQHIAAIVTLAALPVVLGSLALAAQDRYTVQVPEGLSFSEFKGYETWQNVAVSATEAGIKVILANPAMIDAYREGVPGDGKKFPEGAMSAKIEWMQKKNTESPYSVTVPGTLKSVSFIMKDSKRFPKTNGWAYAQFAYDAATDTFKPSVTGAECGYACHTIVAAKDYVFTAYPFR
jgi:hypothetical protein